MMQEGTNILIHGAAYCSLARLAKKKCWVQTRKRSASMSWKERTLQLRDTKNRLRHRTRTV
jgi:hypothetical protein